MATVAASKRADEQIGEVWIALYLQHDGAVTMMTIKRWSKPRLPKQGQDRLEIRANHACIAVRWAMEGWGGGRKDRQTDRQTDKQTHKSKKKALPSAAFCKGKSHRIGRNGVSAW